MKKHELKILSIHYADVLSGKKRAEFRLNDRFYEVGDELILNEWIDGKFTGNQIIKKVCHVTNLDGYADGYVMLSLD